MISRDEVGRLLCLIALSQPVLKSLILTYMSVKGSQFSVSVALLGDTLCGSQQAFKGIVLGPDLLGLRSKDTSLSSLQLMPLYKNILANCRTQTAHIHSWPGRNLVEHWLYSLRTVSRIAEVSGGQK